LLDASALIDWLKGSQRAVDILRGLIERDETLAVNAISIAEIYSGFSAQERADEQPFLRGLEYWPMDRGVAEAAGTYRYQYARLGRPLSVTDCLLAAHAISEDATLITDNVRDFPMPELKILKLRG
jgi:predicted nucleic acid-binding protein